MGRRPRNPPLFVYLNGRRVGTLTKAANGAIAFEYHADWLGWPHAFGISLSLPLRETRYQGEAVAAVFENLLPDSDVIRRRVAERVGARGTDAFALLSVIGRDCVGALQFLLENQDSATPTALISGEVLDDAGIEAILKGLRHAPLGISRDDDFRISVAGAQEKTALLLHQGRWIKPYNVTPTTHILKTQIGHLPGGIDLSDSVENEFYCLTLLAAFGLSVNKVQMVNFGQTRALVIERFDRRWTSDGRLLRLPQEDCCQALGIPPTLKYQNEGGPGIADILRLLQGSDTPTEDQIRFFKACLVFYLIGATDGHAKNVSLHLGPNGSYRLTPFYDVLSAEPAYRSGQIKRKQMKLAMSAGDKRHYRLDQIHGRHFVQTAQRGGLSRFWAIQAMEQVAEQAPAALERAAEALPEGFPPHLHETISKAALARLPALSANLVE